MAKLTFDYKETINHQHLNDVRERINSSHLNIEQVNKNISSFYRRRKIMDGILVINCVTSILTLSLIFYYFKHTVHLF